MGTKIKGDWDIEGNPAHGKFSIRATEDLDKPKFELRDTGDVWWYHKEEWTKIGSHAKQLQHCLRTVVIVNDSDDSLYKWNYGEPESWEMISEDVKKCLVPD